MTNRPARGGNADQPVAPARLPDVGAADEVLCRHQEKLDLYWRNIINSRNEPGELATWVKCIFLEGYKVGRADGG